MRQKLTLKQRIGKLLIPNLPLSRENFDLLRFELNAFLVNTKNQLSLSQIAKLKKLRSQTNLSVNIGAGPFGKKDWINIDMFKLDNITLVYDCRKKFPFSDNSVMRIRCEHVFEHLDKKDEVPKFLSEAHRCLTPNGVLRIVVPDLELFVNAYCSKSSEEWRKLGFDLDNLPDDIQTPMGILNHTFRQNGEHKYGYDFETIQKTVLSSGFKNIQKMSWGQSVDPLLQDDLENHKAYSLYVDCVKD